MSKGQIKLAFRKAAGAAAACLCLLSAATILQGCASGPRTRSAEAPGPEARGPTPLAGGQVTPPADRPVVMELEEETLKAAIETYRIEKKRAAGKYKHAGADLNGDGVPEAVVLFEGRDWCASTGCSLGIFRRDARGYSIVSRTVRVRGPVAVASETTLGWRDLLVWTGGGAAPIRRVQLRFTSDGYASNALLEPDVPVDSTIEGPVLIDVPLPKQKDPAATTAAPPPKKKPEPQLTRPATPPPTPERAPPSPAAAVVPQTPPSAASSETPPSETPPPSPPPLQPDMPQPDQPR